MVISHASLLHYHPVLQGYWNINKYSALQVIGGSKAEGEGVLGMGVTVVDPNSFIFMQFSAKHKVSTPSLELAPHQENPGSATAGALGPCFVR